MTHLSEEQLVLYHYGEAADDAAEQHLAACDGCRTEYELLAKTLAAADFAVPERGADYGEEVWRRIEPRLEAQRRRGWASWFSRGWASFPVPRAWAFAASMAALVVAAFLIGRLSTRISIPEKQAANEPVRERILLVSVGDHLERSQMVLVELANTRPDRVTDISTEQKWAEDLVDSNRLYRQTALQSGDADIASVLDDLERLLLEIANGPSKLSPGELEKIQKRIESQGILFKIRVIGSRVREQEAPVANEKNRGKF